MDAFYAKPPDLHSWDGGKTWNTGGFDGDTLKRFTQLALDRFGTGSRIIETGAGNSTIAFALASPLELTSIAPDPNLFGRIHDYCRENGILLDSWRAIDGLSEIELPPLAAKERADNSWFDMALLDGGHGWPTVFVDFCYMNAMVRKSGLIILDDILLYSVKELARFLKESWQFSEVATYLGGKVRVFEKKSDERFFPDFGGQPYILRKFKEDPGLEL